MFWLLAVLLGCPDPPGEAPLPDVPLAPPGGAPSVPPSPPETPRPAAEEQGSPAR